MEQPAGHELIFLDFSGGVLTDDCAKRNLVAMEKTLEEMSLSELRVRRDRALADVGRYDTEIFKRGMECLALAVEEERTPDPAFSNTHLAVWTPQLTNRFENPPHRGSVKDCRACNEYAERTRSTISDFANENPED